jgi:hypothetical protein
MGGTMSDLFNRVLSSQEGLEKLLAKIPGFKGYAERKNRRAADKLLRETIANRYEEQWQRISAVQRDLISEGGLLFVDDLEASAVKLRQFIDRIRTASYGYAGFFDAIKVKEEELAAIYQYDLNLMALVEEVSQAIDNVEAALGTDGLKTAIRNLTKMAQDCVDAYEKRADVIKELSTGSEPEDEQK